MVDQVDQIVTAKWIIPVCEKEIDQHEATILENASVVLHKDKIVEILPTKDAIEKYPNADITNLPRHVLIPGFINTHTHAAMSLFRGVADDLPLMEWLQDHIWPAEGKWVSESFVHDGTELAMAEMLRSGTTCFNDMYFFPNVVCKAAMDAKIRTSVSFPILDFPSAWANNPEEYIHKGLQLNDDYKNHDLIHVGFGPHAPYTVSDEPLKKIAMLSEELDTHIHIHLHETEHEVQEAIKETGMRPIERLAALGLLSPRLHGVHMTALTDSDKKAIALNGSHIVHCPESNLKLASGFCPVHELQQEGINVALGTDGAASNNDLDMMNEMRTAALLGKAVAADASALAAKEALQMATIRGAIALGLNDTIGSLEPNKFADMTAIELDALEVLPIYNPLSQLVYASSRNQVTDVWVAGHRLLKDRQLTTLDVDGIKERALRWGEKIKEYS